MLLRTAGLGAYHPLVALFCITLDRSLHRADRVMHELRDLWPQPRFVGVAAHARPPLMSVLVP